MEAWDFKLFGELTARKKQSVVTRFRTSKTGSLLAYLLCHPQIPIPREVLVDKIWPEADHETGRGSLRVALHSLRNQLELTELDKGIVFIVDRQTIQINPESVNVDYTLFNQSLYLAARAETAEEKIAHLSVAVEKYHGELLAGYSEEWIYPLRSACIEQYLLALQSLSQYHQARSEWYVSLEYARRVQLVDPFNEEVLIILMECYSAIGKLSLAKKQLRNYNALLEKEFGSGAPENLSQYLKQFLKKYKTILPTSIFSPEQNPVLKIVEQSVPAAGVADNSVTSTFEPRLPAIPTCFFGRASEIEQIHNLISTDHARVLTITGLGGTGKTRLAIEAAKGLTKHFEGGVWFVPLAELKNPSLILESIHTAIGLEWDKAEPPLPRIVSALRGRPALLVLDNFEHLVIQETDAAIVRNILKLLLEELEDLKCIISSRVLVGIPGEHQLSIQPLPFPIENSVTNSAISYPSVQLFVDRARTKRPDFALTTRNAIAISALCAKLEGIPLAIELAATRAQVLTPAQMLIQLEHRYQFLANSGSQFPERHRSLLATVEWSYDLLPKQIQQFFIKLSVFKGSWSVKSAQKVCIDGWESSQDHVNDTGGFHSINYQKAIDMLAILLDRSLIQTFETGEEMRYGMLETMREFGDEKLDETTRNLVRYQFAHFYMDLVEEIEPLSHGVHSKDHLDTIEIEYDNILGAMDWTLESKSPEIGLRMLCSLIPFWPVRRSAVAALEMAINLLDLCKDVQAEWKISALSISGDLAKEVGKYELASSLYQQEIDARKSFGQIGPIKAEYVLGKIALLRNSYREALTSFVSYCEQIRDSENPIMVAYMECEIAFTYMLLGEYESGLSRGASAVSICLLAEDKYVTAYAYHLIGSIYMRMGRYEAARESFQECLKRREERNDQAGISATFRNLGRICAYLGDSEKGLTMLRSALKYYNNHNNDVGICDTLEGILEHWVACSQYRIAVLVAGALSRLREKCLDGLLPCDLPAHNARISRLRIELGATIFTETWNKGRNMSTAEIVSYVFTEPVQT